MRMRSTLAMIALVLAAPLSAQNLVSDPAFTQGVGAWSSLGVTGNYSITFNAGVSRRPGSGSALLSFDSPAFGSYVTCVDVVPGQQYDWGYSIRYPDAARLVGLNELFDRFTGPGCTGSSLGGYFLPLSPGVANVNIWMDTFAARFVAPATCQSVRIGFGAVGLGGAKITAQLDDVFVGATGTVPPIDPLPAIPSLSTLGLLALGAALALAALRILRA